MIIGIDISRMNIAQPTGVERYTCEVVPRVIERLIADSNVTEIWLYSPYSLDTLKSVYPQFSNPKIRERHLDMPFKLFWTLIRLTLHFLNPFTKKPDVFWVPSHIMPLWMPGKMRSYQSMHDIAYRTYPESYSWRSKLVMEIGMSVARRHGTRFFYISDFTKSEVNKHYPWTQAGEGGGVVTKLGGDHLKAGVEAGIHNSEAISNPYILYVSRLEEKKGTVHLLNGFDLLKDKLIADPRFKNTKLVLVGKPGFGFEHTKAVMDNMRYKGDVIWKGFIDDNELKSLYAGAEMIVNPSMYEGFGIPVLETFYFGKPLACSDRTSLPEVAGDGAEYFDPTEPAQLADACYKVLTNPKLRQKLVDAGKARLRLFSWDKCADIIAGTLKSSN